MGRFIVICHNVSDKNPSIWLLYWGNFWFKNCLELTAKQATLLVDGKQIALQHKCLEEPPPKKKKKKTIQ